MKRSTSKSAMHRPPSLGPSQRRSASRPPSQSAVLAQLSLSSKNIKKIDPSLFQGPLSSLDLSDNMISQIDGLQCLARNLKQLNLSYNSISKIQNLQLPYLQVLNLSHNRITILENLDNLKNLEILILSHNRINRLVGLPHLGTLKELKVDHNQIQLLEGLRAVPKLEQLDASFNEMAPLMPQDLSEVKFLEKLSLQNCDLESCQWLLPLKNILELRIDGNPDLLNFDSFPRLQKLEMLSVSRCGIISLQMTKERFPSLVILDLSFNNIRSILDVQELQGLNQLAELTLLNNPLANQGPEYRTKVLDICPQLQILDKVTLCEPGTKFRDQTEKLYLKLLEEEEEKKENKKPIVTVDDIFDEIKRGGPPSPLKAKPLKENSEGNQTNKALAKAFINRESELQKVTQEIEEFQRKMNKGKVLEGVDQDGEALLESIARSFNQIRKRAHAAGDKVRMAEQENLRKLAIQRCESRAQSRQQTREASPRKSNVLAMTGQLQSNQRAGGRESQGKIRGASISGLKKDAEAKRKEKEQKYKGKIGVNPFPRMKRMASITRKTEFQKAVEEQMNTFLAQTAELELKSSTVRQKIQQARQFTNN